MSRNPDVVALAVCGVALILSIVGLAVPKWIVTNTTKYGLWRICTSRGFCSSYPSGHLPDGLEAVRAMVLLGMILVLGGLVAAAVKKFWLKDKAVLSLVAFAMAVSAGVFMLIGVIMFAVKYEDFAGVHVKSEDLHASFALTIVAAILSELSGIIFFLRRNVAE